MSTRRAKTSWWVLLLVTMICVFPVVTAAISQGADAGASPVDSCWSSELPPGTELRDDSLRSVDITAIPAGRHCDWEAGDTQTGWPVTIAALVATAICLLATAFALRQGGAGRRILVSLPLVAIAVIWVVMWSAEIHIIID